jgi:hypothetical protein
MSVDSIARGCACAKIELVKMSVIGILKLRLQEGLNCCFANRLVHLDILDLCMYSCHCFSHGGSTTELPEDQLISKSFTCNFSSILSEIGLCDYFMNENGCDGKPAEFNLVFMSNKTYRECTRTV